MAYIPKTATARVISVEPLYSAMTRLKDFALGLSQRLLSSSSHRIIASTATILTTARRVTVR